MLKILIVKDDSAESLHLLERRYQEVAKFREAGDLETAFDYLERGDIACILLDSQLGDVNGREVFGTLREKYPDSPIVVMLDNLTRADEMLGRGAAGYVVKRTTNDDGVFETIISALTRLGRPLPAELLAGRLDPEASTQPPKHPLPQVEGAESIPPVITYTSLAPMSIGRDKVSFDDVSKELTRRVEALEARDVHYTRQLRLATWFVIITVLVSIALMFTK